jgi:hypothetical protein
MDRRHNEFSKLAIRMDFAYIAARDSHGNVVAGDAF